MKKAQRSIALLLVIVSILAMLPTALAASYTGIINTDKVFFRKKASTSADYYAILKKNTSVTVTGSSGDFYSVTYNNRKGYVMKKFVSAAPSPATNDSKAPTVQSKYASITSATTIAALGAVPSATKVGSTGNNVAKLQQALKLKGYKITVDGIYGNGTASTVKAYQKKVGLSQTGTADKNTLNVLFGKTTPKQTATPTGKTTTAATDPQMKGITKISQISVPATTSKGSSGKNVLALQQALKLKGYYKAPINSKYDENTVAAVKAFQKAKRLYVDGVAGNNTIKALFGKNASNYTFKTERLDWFHGGASRIPRGAIFEVKDVRTGRTFSCKRLFGANHMDSEPLTKSDAATLKSIYGGHYSWNRRAILVKYNGRVYAGSMNGMPHGTSTIDNGWPGHFCIHFYGSMTHGTKKVDSAHQAAVTRAMSATW
ncbi:MAG: peptidoglycan-binding protein [Clostridia bacterium]|nr:peptidoglycan-binding protein [Clostridia bacterium]